MELFSVVAKLLLDKSGYDSDVKDANESGKTLADNLARYMEKAKKAIAAIGIGIAVKRAAQELWNLARETAEAGDRIDKTSQSLGMSRRAFQEWDYILSQSGASIDSLGMTMKTMSEVIMSGSAEAAAAFSRLGLSAAQLSSMTPEQQFETLVRAFQQMPPGADKSALAIQIFGRNAQSLMPLLNSAAGSIDELKKRAEELGLIMSDEDVDAAVAFGDALDDLNRTWMNFKFKIGGQLLPGFAQAIKGAAESLGRISTALVGAFKSGDWSVFFATLSTEIERGIPSIVDGALGVINGIFANADKLVGIAVSIITGLANGIINSLPILEGKLPEIVNTIWAGMSSLIEGLGNKVIGVLNETFGTNIPEIDLSGVQDAFQWFVDNKETIISAVGAILAAFVTTNIATFVASLNPVAVGFAAVAGAIALVALNWNQIKDWIGEKWETVVSWVNENFPEVSEAFQEISQWFNKTVNVTVEWFVNNWPEIKNGFDTATEWIGKAVRVYVKWLKDGWTAIFNAFTQLEKWHVKAWKATVKFVRNSWETIKSAFDKLGQWTVKTWIATVKFARKLWDDITGAIDKVKEWGTAALTIGVTFAKKLWEDITGAVDDIKEWGTAALEIGVSFIRKTWDDITSAVDSVKEWGTAALEIGVSFVRKLWDDITSAVDSVKEWMGTAWEITVSWSNTGWLAVKNAFSLLGSWLNRKANEIKVAWTSTIDDWITTINGWIDAGVNATIKFGGKLMGWAETVWDWIQHGVNVSINFLGGLFSGGGSEPSTYTLNGQTFSDPMGAFTNNGGVNSFAKGLNYVPFDGYAYLHRGETVLNQDKGREYRQKGGMGFNSDSLYSAVANAVAAAVENIQINMDGNMVGNAVTNRVSRNMYQKQLGRRFATV